MSKEIHYTFSASAEPPEPTESDSLYSAPLTYPVGGGYYAAKAWQDGMSSSITRKSFERVTLFPSAGKIVNVYNFNTSLTDLVGVEDCITPNGFVYESSPFDNAINTSSDKYAVSVNSVVISATQILTMYLRFKPTSTADNKPFYSLANTPSAGTPKIILQTNTAGQIRLFNGSYTPYFGSGLHDGNYHNIIIVLNYSSRTITVTIDTISYIQNIGTTSATNNHYYGNGYPGNGHGLFDQVVIWEGYIPTESDFIELYNNGDGLKYT